MSIVRTVASEMMDWWRRLRRLPAYDDLIEEVSRLTSETVTYEIAGEQARQELLKKQEVLRHEFARTNVNLINSRATVRQKEATIQSLHEIIAQLTEPSAVTCTKIRLWNKEMAEAFARKVEQETHCGEMKAYRCDVCPRQPLEGVHFWHITHVDRELRGRKYNSSQRAHEQEDLFYRLDSDQVRDLNRRARKPE
jgi:uncharacterized protein with PIN domain